ncbi:hypothetical protein CTAYLR_009979 [Chrysophaeum taylorii]|uniref:signal-recognition-particle GTPase n=1 Tax=Chrysophaeum taylorii TaxID=2483200 RepID=A0AAD7XNZ3_9STRA|nr:hypothetical protein CTAYLR_009979 [Chrysophaeum taylorii]
MLWRTLLLAALTAGFQAPTQQQQQQQHRRWRSQLYFFDKLSEAMSDISQTLSGKQRLTEKNIAKALKDVKRALIDADVNLQVTNGLVKRVRGKAVGTQVVAGVEPAQQFAKAMYDELVEVMGGDPGADEAMQTRFELEGKVILLCGLQGAGKTTAAAKLANYLKVEEKREPLLIAADVFRPAAADQLRILGSQIGVDVYVEDNCTDAVGIATRGVSTAGYDVYVVDTAGRQVVDDALMTELVDIRKAVSPDETLLVLDAMTGQDAASLCARFDSTCDLTGAVLTKLDGDSRGGAALSVRAVSGVPIKFVGVGEKLADLEPFYPARMASRILGMGDVVSLVEKAQKKVSDADAKAQMERMTAGQFTFEDYLAQTETLASMGNFAGVAKMMPGFSGIDASKIDAAELKAKRAKALIQSMTPKERRLPDLLIRDKTSISRMTRIGKGAGFDLRAAQTFIAEFQAMRTMMARMAAGPGASSPTKPPSSPVGNRAARRAGGKKKAKRRAPARGF